MFCMCESTNFLWSTKSILGTGATATVYQGVNKINGDLVAVKCYNNITYYNSREFDVLRKINHEHIVKLIAIEQNFRDGKQVLVMELCTGGSILDGLMDPKNAYGLEEYEFLLIIKHICSGIKYMRDNNIIHRDLKPGNIMKFIQEDDTVVYKIADFGAARNLTDDETFQSIYGTKPYLHPDIYNIAILKKQNKTHFNSSVDLWSIGVTLFHIATGTLPFHASKDETLYEIITMKDSGVISGVETEENGAIKWSRELPITCLLSEGLKRNVVPIIAGLLETNPSKVWNFDKFFTEVEVFLSRIPITIFYVNTAKLIKVYMLPHQNYKDLQRNVSDQTDIECVNQVFFYKNNFLENTIDESTKISDFPETDTRNPLFLFDKANDDFSIPPVFIPEWKGLETNTSVEGSFFSAKFACIIGHYCSRKVEEYSTYCKLIYDFGHNFIDSINRDIKELELKLYNLLEKIRLFEKFGEIIECDKRYGNNKLKKISREMVTAMSVETAKLYDIQCLQDIIKSNWQSTLENLDCPFKTRAIARGNTQVMELRKFWKHFKKELLHSNTSYSNEYLRVLEREKIRQRLNNIITLLIKEIFPQCQQMTKNFEGWYRSTKNIYSEIDIVKLKIEQYEERLEYLEKELHAHRNNINKEIQKQDDMEKADKLRNLKKNLKDYCEDTDNFEEILKENTKLMNMIKDFKHVKL